MKHQDVLDWWGEKDSNLQKPGVTGEICTPFLSISALMSTRLCGSRQVLQSIQAFLSAPELWAVDANCSVVVDRRTRVAG